MEVKDIEKIITVDNKKFRIFGEVGKNKDGLWINSLNISVNIPDCIEGSMSGFTEYNETFENYKTCVESLLNDIRIFIKNRHNHIKKHPKELKEIYTAFKQVNDSLENLTCKSCENTISDNGSDLCQACLEVKNKFHLVECEKVISEGLSSFLLVGNALSDIRSKKLYSFTHSTFEDYCQDKWKITSRHARNLINEAQVIKSLQEAKEPVFIPEIESEARPLTRLEPELVLEVAKELEKKKNEGVDITANVVENEVTKKIDVNKVLKDVKKKPLFYQNETPLVVAERIAEEKRKSKEKHPNAVQVEEKAPEYFAPEKDLKAKPDPEMVKTIFSSESVPVENLLITIKSFSDWDKIARGQLEEIYRIIRSYHLAQV